MSETAVNTVRWRKVVLKCHLIIAICIFVVEIVANALLYVTRSQGYGPDTIVEKLLRYLVLTSFINFGSVILSRYLSKRFEDHKCQPYILFILLSIICIDVEHSHYQFAICFAVSVLPVLLSILYENIRLTRFVFVLNLFGLILGIVGRALDSEYNKDIGPEAAISFAFLISCYYFCKLIIGILLEHQSVISDMAELRQKNKMLKEIEFERQQFKQLSEETFNSLAMAVDIKDVYTSGHSQRVADYSKMIAEKLYMSVDEIWEVYYAGLLHDVGKLGIDNSIINKPAKLTDEEYAEIKRHPSMGYRILSGISIRGNFAYGAKTHHERIDGKGYPDGLKGDEIPLIGRIISVADSYDAMTSYRAYRPLMKQEDVRREFVNGRGTQFDEQITDIMLDIIDNDVNYELHQ